MAQKIQTLFIDDLDGSEATGTVRFGLDGTEYEIDLSAAHSDELRKALEQYIRHGRRTGGTARRTPRSRRATDTVDTAKIREWMEALLTGVAEGWVRPHVDRSFPLAQAGEAQSYIEERRNTGKVVLLP